MNKRPSRSTRIAFGIFLCALSIGRAAAQQPTGPSRTTGPAAAPLVLPDQSWPCGMPGGIPSPESGTLVFEVAMSVERVADVGLTQFGLRTVAIVSGGNVTGSRLTAAVNTGALDFQLTLTNGTIEIEQRLVLRTSSGKYILVRGAGTGRDASDVRVVLDFEAPNESDTAWLNTGTYVARRVVDRVRKTMTLRVYAVSALPPAPAAREIVRITKPAGVPAQPWDYRRATPDEKPGAQLITERVTLAPGQLVGPSKRGNRNIIPITGGELSGRLTGSVIAGGADYQILTPPATIDAHYLWQTADGEIVIVRNGGAFGSLVPTFEARAAGPYAWLNSGRYLSSNPQPSPGGVALTFYESSR